MRTHLDLFSGIGGFALAAEWAGFTAVRFCEIDPFCQKVLKKHWPETPIHDDIRTLTADVVGQPIDLLTGGFPCQPFSLAGKQLGAADDRHLWPEMARVIDECRPRWVLGENTPGIIGMELDNCLADLESLGYEAWPVVIPAVGVGAWHQRQRVWIIAHAEDGGIRRGIAPREAGLTAFVHEDASYADGERFQEQRFPAANGSQLTGSELVGADVADSPRIGERESANEADAITDSRHAWQIAGSRNWWGVESRVRGVPDGLSSGVDRRAARLKSLGNAIVPQVAYQIIRHMAVMP